MTTAEEALVKMARNLGVSTPETRIERGETEGLAQEVLRLSRIQQETLTDPYAGPSARPMSFSKSQSMVYLIDVESHAKTFL